MRALCIVYMVGHMSKHTHNTMLIDTARVSVVRLILQFRPPSSFTAQSVIRTTDLPVVTLTLDFRQLSVVPLIEEWDTSAAPQGGTVSNAMLALRFLAFKERPLGPPPTVLLNKQGWLSADHNHWAKMKSSLEQGTRLGCLLSICFMYLDQFTDLDGAILIITSSLQAQSLRSSAKSVVHEAGS